MGGELRAAPGQSRAPTFVVAASRDMLSGQPLSRLQVVKGWLDADGQPSAPELAIKVLYAQRDNGPFLRRLATEAQILQDLNHPAFANAVGVLVAYQANCAANPGIVANRELYNNVNLCFFVRLIMLIQLSANRVVDVRTVRSVQGWEFTLGNDVPTLCFGDTYADAERVLQVLFAANSPDEVAFVKQVFCNFQEL
jgi:hypothetical protein